MTAPLSIVIPTLNSEKEISNCLAHLAPGIQAGLIREVIVVDGGSTDKTILIAFRWGARVICSAAAGRGRQLRTGGLNAKGKWLLFLHADTWLEESWDTAIQNHITSEPNKAGAFTLAYRSHAKQARWLEKRANARSKWLGLPYGDQGLFISKVFYDEVGGFDDVPLMEDVAIMRRIGKKRLSLFAIKAQTCAAKYERDGWRKRAWRNAWLITQYHFGVDPGKLANAYD